MVSLLGEEKEGNKSTGCQSNSARIMDLDIDQPLFAIEIECRYDDSL